MGRIGAERSVPLATISFSGNRYVVDADLGLAAPVPLMVHGNARVFLSLTHVVAERLAGRPVAPHDRFGYTTRGRGAIEVPTLRVGGSEFGPVADVPVFDFTDDPGAPAQGMLGTRFLLDARAALDFGSETLILGVASAAERNPDLLERGYVGVPMQVHDDFRLSIDVFVPAIGRSIPITPSTVADALTLHRPLFDGVVAMIPAEPDRSPGGTSPDRFTSAEIDFEVGGVACRSAAILEDLAEYADVEEKALSSVGMLGFDWMRAHAAVLDYANRFTYFLP